MSAEPPSEPILYANFTEGEAVIEWPDGHTSSFRLDDVLGEAGTVELWLAMVEAFNAD